MPLDLYKADMTFTSPASKVDVLIVGAGPAGLMAATWMAQLGIKTRIVDKRGSKVYAGQADGFQARSLEILDSFGIGDRVWKESNHMIGIGTNVCQRSNLTECLL